MKSVSENISLCTDLFHQFPWSTQCLILHLEFPSGGVDGQQPQQHRVQSLQRQKTDALTIVQWLANSLGKCQFVVDTMLFNNILRHDFPFTFLHKYYDQ